jgi:hypothetical protein
MTVTTNMASLTLKNVPDELLGAVREAAEADRRSLNQQIIHLLEVALVQRIEKPGRAREIEAQLAEWRRLASKWQPDLAPAAEADKLIRRRSRGRRVDL